MKKRTCLSNPEDYTSNILRDSKELGKFQETATQYAKNLSQKYYTLLGKYEPEDVVQEIWHKILRQDISYDSSKSKTFKGFVRMLVERQYIDLCRKVQKEVGNISTESVICEDSEMTILDILVEEVDSMEEMLNNRMLEDFFDILPNEYKRNVVKYLNGCTVEIPISIQNIIKLKMDGMTLLAIAEYFDVNYNYIIKLIGKYKDMWTTCNEYMGDIVYMPDNDLV
jgi:DNA-directed RNA polymerase specialized sigma24 family protein